MAGSILQAMWRRGKNDLADDVSLVADCVLSVGRIQKNSNLKRHINVIIFVPVYSRAPFTKSSETCCVFQIFTWL